MAQSIFFQCAQENRASGGVLIAVLTVLIAVPVRSLPRTSTKVLYVLYLTPRALSNSSLRSGCQGAWVAQR